jgi:hypothetical protein
MYRLIVLGWRLADKREVMARRWEQAKWFAMAASVYLADSHELGKILKERRRQLPAELARVEQEVADLVRERGEDDKETLFARHHLAALRGMAQDAAGAAAEYDRVAAGKERTLGVNHHDPQGDRHLAAYWRRKAEEQSRRARRIPWRWIRRLR